jgi:uncharacterized protein (TIGR04222 family)
VFDWLLWLSSNPDAMMYGPYYLAFYGIATVVTLVVCGLNLRAVDRTAALPPHPIPARLDPYPIAYLRGGENELVRTVIFSLIERGYLRPSGADEPQGDLSVQDPKGGWQAVSPSPATRAADQKIEWSPQRPDTRHLSPLELHVFNWFSLPLLPHDVFVAGRTSELSPLFDSYYRELEAEELLVGPEMRQKARRIWSVGASVIVGLGAGKLCLALATGHQNVGGLWAIGIVGILILYGMTHSTERLTRRGKSYLQQLRKAFQRLQKERVRSIQSERGADFTLPLLVGIFGVGVLAGTPYGYYPEIFQRAAAGTSGGCGSSSGASCGASCGGGGGGCGGGGCGGCGGGS